MPAFFCFHKITLLLAYGLWLWLLWRCRGALTSMVKELPKWGKAGLLAVVVVAGALRAFHPRLFLNHQLNQMYQFEGDPLILFSSFWQLPRHSYHGLGGFVLAAVVEQIPPGGLVPWMAFQSLLGTLLCGMVMLLAWRLLDDLKAGLAAGFLMALSPAAVRVSNSEEYPVLIMTLMVLMALLLVRWRERYDARLLYAAAVTGALCLQVRGEMFLWVPAFGLALFVWPRKEQRGSMWRPVSIFPDLADPLFMRTLIGALAVFGLLAAPHFLYLLWYALAGKHGLLGFSSCSTGMLKELWFSEWANVLINPTFTPRLLLLLIPIGIVALLRKEVRKTGMGIIVFLAAYFRYYTSGYTFDWVDALRYQGNYLWVVMLVAGAGAGWLWQAAERRLGKTTGLIMIGLLLAAVAAQGYIFRQEPLFLMTNAHREDAFLRRAIRELPQGSILWCFNPIEDQQSRDDREAAKLKARSYRNPREGELGMYPAFLAARKGIILKPFHEFTSLPQPFPQTDYIYRGTLWYAFQPEEYYTREEFIRACEVEGGSPQYRFIRGPMTEELPHLPPERPEAAAFEASHKLVPVLEETIPNVSVSWPYIHRDTIPLAMVKIE